MLLSQYGCRSDYGTHDEPVKPWDVASYLGVPPWWSVPAFELYLPRVGRLFDEFELSLEVKEYGPFWQSGDLERMWEDL